MVLFGARALIAADYESLEAIMAELQLSDRVARLWSSPCSSPFISKATRRRKRSAT